MEVSAVAQILLTKSQWEEWVLCEQERIDRTQVARGILLFLPEWRALSRTNTYLGMWVTALRDSSNLFPR